MILFFAIQKEKDLIFFHVNTLSNDFKDVLR